MSKQKTSSVHPVAFHAIIPMVMSLTALALAGCSGGTPEDEKLLRQGAALEMKSDYSGAIGKYAEAASLGNADAFKRLGDIAISREYTILSPDNPSDYAEGYDKWLDAAKSAVAKAGDFYEKAQIAGCTNKLDISFAKLETCKKKIAETEAKVKAAKESKRQEELRKKEEARQAELRRQEELRRKQEEERRRAEEAARRESAEYCIDNGLVLTDKAFREVVRAVNYSSDTGNKLYDAQKDKEEHARFAGKRLVIKGKVSKVETTFFTDEVKIIVSCNGGTISARFDGMSKQDAAGISVGSSIHMSGYVSNRPVLSSIAMDRCVFE